MSSLVLCLLVFSANTPASAQETVVIGGSGQSSVEVNLEVLDLIEGRAPRGTALRHPQTATPRQGPVHLRAPIETEPLPVERPATDPVLVPTEKPPREDLPPVVLAPPVPLERPEFTREPKPTSPDPAPTGAARARAGQKVEPSETPAGARIEASAPGAAQESTITPQSEAQPSAQRERLAQSSSEPDGPMMLLVPEPAPARPSRAPIVESRAEPKASTGLDAPTKTRAKTRDEPPSGSRAKPQSQTSVQAPPKAKVEKRQIEAAPAQAVDAAATQKSTQEETKVARLTPTETPEAAAPDSLRIAFASGETNLPRDAKTSLGSLASRLNDDQTLRVQLRAYAGADADGASQARRLSLSRALAVRSALIEGGVRSTRIDVRALGNKAEEGPSDRVDVFVVAR